MNFVGQITLHQTLTKNNQVMLIIDVKDGENIDRALKRYKRKYRDTKIMQEIRKRREYKKPSVQRRNEILKAQYRNEKMLGMEE